MHLSISVTLALAVIAPSAPTAPPFFAEPAVVADAKGFVAEWDRPGVHADVLVTHEVKVGQPVTVFVLFRGCRSAPDGACHVKASLQVIGPDGKPTPLAGSFVVWSKPVPDPTMIYRSEQAPTIGFDKGDALGRYVVRTTVTDEGDGRAPIVVQREAPLDVTAS